MTISRPKLLSATAAVFAIAAAAYWVVTMSRTEAPPGEGAGPPDLMSFVADMPDEGFERPPSTWKLTLPGDHGNHAASRTENWQLSAHLRTENGERLGVQFSYLRLGLVPPSAAPAHSVWEPRDVYRGHVVFVDTKMARAMGEERFARGMPALAGYDAAAGELRLDDWFLRFGGARDDREMALHATIRDETLVQLTLRPEKPALASELDGAEAPFVGYALTRLAVEGTVDQGSGAETVIGTAWFDHSWGDLPLPGAGPVAWDRLQFQLEDGTDVSVIRSRRTDGRGDPTLNGVVVEADGTVSTFDDETFQMTAIRSWRRDGTEAEYPVEWRLEGPDLDVTVAPVTDAQAYDFSTPFWSGLVTVRGTRGEGPVSGMGTLQLTGYEQR